MKSLALAAALLALGGCAYHADPAHPPTAGLFPTTYWCQQHPSPQIVAELNTVISPQQAEANRDLVAATGIIGGLALLATETPAQHKFDADLTRDRLACIARHGWLLNSGSAP